MKKSYILILIFVFVSMFLLISCGNSNNDYVNEAVKPQSINIITNTRISKKNSSLNIEYEILPKEYSYNNISCKSDNESVEASIKNNCIVVKSNNYCGLSKITLCVDDLSKSFYVSFSDISESKNINLNGYEINILNLYSNDNPNLYNTSKYDEYKKLLEEKYNCKIEFTNISGNYYYDHVSYINEIVNENNIYDFAITNHYNTTRLVDAKDLIDLTDYYAGYDISRAIKKDKKIYGIDLRDNGLSNVMIYNYELWEKLNQIDNTIEEPASLFINGKWSVDDFIEYCDKCKNALKTLGEDYYCLTGIPALYYKGIYNSCGIKITGNGKPLLTSAEEIDILKKFNDFELFDKNYGVLTSSAWDNGKVLFNVSKMCYFKNETKLKTIFCGNDSVKGIVPFPSDTEECNVALKYDNCLFMLRNRDRNHDMYGCDCNYENISKVMFEFFGFNNELNETLNDKYNLVFSEKSQLVVNKVIENANYFYDCINQLDEVIVVVNLPGEVSFFTPYERYFKGDDFDLVLEQLKTFENMDKYWLVD